MTLKTMKCVLAITLTFFSLTAFSQSKEYTGIPSLVWPKLWDIEYKTGQDEFGEIDIPVFSEKVKKLEGTRILLPGYMIPFSGSFKEDHFILSALPVNACFFCGTGGPESVIEVYSTKPIPFSEKPIEVKGTLKLNDSDPEHMIYILEDTEYLGTVDF